MCALGWQTVHDYLYHLRVGTHPYIWSGEFPAYTPMVMLGPWITSAHGHLASGDNNVATCTSSCLYIRTYTLHVTLVSNSLLAETGPYVCARRSVRLLCLCSSWSSSGKTLRSLACCRTLREAHGQLSKPATANRNNVAMYILPCTGNHWQWSK